MEKFGIHEGALPLVLEPYNPKLSRTTALVELISSTLGDVATDLVIASLYGYA